MDTHAAGDDTLTIEEIAEHLRVSKSTVLRSARRGSLRTVKLGRTLRVLRSSYEQFIADGGERISA